MIFGVAKELADDRVALIPENVQILVKLGETVLVEKNAGINSTIDDEEYKKAGANIVTRKDLFEQSEFILKIQPPTSEELEFLRAGTSLLGQLQPLMNPQLIKALAEKKITLFSMDVIPRTTKAQAMDVLSSMSTVAGYKAVLLAATHLPRFFPMLTTAAGTIAPAKVLILGAGVAGLQAIATAKRLGAVVEAFDTRPEVKEQVMSVGAKFIEVEGAVSSKDAGGYAIEQTEDYKQRQRDAIHKSASKADVIITTALIPGRKAPLLITEETIKAMKRGSVIVDMAAIQGGNAQLTESGKTIQVHGVTIIGESNLASTIPFDASRMFGKNVVNFLKHMYKENKLIIDLEDEIISGTCIANSGTIRHEPTLKLLGS
ncbi:MAG: Re/Si-specific NAD(P)(+) transhydrogenase subunit alpha [Leptospiraceae bacterium]|nr:Re/Si-specific NAD(P)(+) transhydrogenase subunit alpha [Leptospiraceae bacterium]